MDEKITKPLDKEQIRFLLEQIKNTDWSNFANVLLQLKNYLETVASNSDVYKYYKEQSSVVFKSCSNYIAPAGYMWNMPSNSSEEAKLFSFYIYMNIKAKYCGFDEYTSRYSGNDPQQLLANLNKDLMPYFAKALQDIENDCISFDSANLGSEIQKLWNTNIIIYGDVIGSAISALGKAEINIEDVKNYSGLDSEELKAILLDLYKQITGEDEPKPNIWDKLKNMAPQTAAMLFKFVLDNLDKIPEIIKA